jgi:hydrogenase-4 component F
MELLFILTSFFISALIGISIRHRRIIEASSIAASAVAFVESITVSLKVASSGSYAPFTFFSVDALGAIVMLIIACVGLAVTVYSVEYLRQETAKNIIGFTRVRQYFVLLDLFIAAMFLAITASSPIVTWISIEATTLSTAFLISFYNKPSAMEAAWKYLIINSIGLLLGFFGTLLYFIPLNPLQGSGLVTWQLLAANTAHFNPLIARIAFVFILIGYGTKVGLVPMHTWLPDAHSKAPAPISALLSGVLLNVAFVVVLRFKNITDAVVGKSFSQNFLILFGVISMLVAALIILTQTNYKRLLAYSSIENMGIISLGFGFGGLGVFAAILHMIYHALVKSTLFLSAGTVLLKYSSTKIARVTGVLAALTVTGILFLTAFFFITGTPPFGIFLTKIFILSAGIKAHPAVTLIALFSMAVLFVGFFKHVTAMSFGKKPAEIKAGEGSIWLIVPPLALIAVASYLSFHIPGFLFTLINGAVSHE